MDLGGGPIYRDTSDLAAELVVTDGTGSSVTAVKSTLKQGHRVSFWSPEYALPSGIKERTALIKDLLDKAVCEVARVQRARVHLEKGGLS